MRTLIIEDEPLAIERLQILLRQVCPDVKVEACLDSVADSITWFQEKPLPDFVLMDIHLSDGSAFEIFRQVDIDVPVIFTTAYDQYAIEAFQLMSIDYLLKPISADSLGKAIQKMRKLKSGNNPGVDYQEILSAIQNVRQQYKSRFLVKVGHRSFFVKTDEIAYFQADNKIVYLVALDGCRYITEHKLEILEQLLDPQFFFRANRSTIVRVSAIDQIKPYINSRLKLVVKVGSGLDELVVSRERVTAFKEWAEQ
ncbi:LytR/AlgR family response regulator transcription factor [Flavihumibacter profundi]|jgi:two-component system, LytTR family, response regulator LytT|uniref:LytR/AlgR family response regulator transcription factor n=1 Tax=Flavihumibacter profundi TaxID=2716883 RepID=UPI001CC69F6E|nr:LytTR family DNA-binding domain-containing protein [Flavihumibacter profundi]MBZ5858761.1 LytTR family DNA-binding domain-containing protein [Flavihumibacter profundi]